MPYESYIKEKDFKRHVFYVDSCYLCLGVASDGHPEDEIIRQFKMEFDLKKEKCAVLIVRATSHSEKWTLAGFDDAGEFRTAVIDDPNHELSKELKDPRNERRIVELATSSLEAVWQKFSNVIYFKKRDFIVITERRLINVSKRFIERRMGINLSSF